MRSTFNLRPILSVCALSALTIAFTNCDAVDDTNNGEGNYGIFSVINDTTVSMDGEINSSSLVNFNQLLTDYPAVDSISIREVNGSSDDEVNLQVSQLVHQKNIVTHLTSNGLIASGGVDFFLAGIRRTKGTNTQIGVHSWSDGSNEATDYPVGDANHQPYIDYYQSVGFTQEDAEAFYYFTINAALASSIHWMTEAEIVEFELLTR
ncbi:MAG: alpha/beta hydrolase [Saprospiraceae bacterium]